MSDVFSTSLALVQDLNMDDAEFLIWLGVLVLVAVGIMLYLDYRELWRKPKGKVEQGGRGREPTKLVP